MADPYYRPYLADSEEEEDSFSESFESPSASQTQSQPQSPPASPAQSPPASPQPEPKPRPVNANPDVIDERTVQAPNFKALAVALAAPPPERPQFPITHISTIKHENHKIVDRRTTAYPYIRASGPPPAAPLPTYADVATNSRVQSVIVLRSRDRDRSVYPQPTNCQLFLPRDYKNITGFAVTELNLISAFFYFSNAKNNVVIQILEKGNVYYSIQTTNPQVLLDTTGNKIPLILTNYIREGSYNITQLLNELTIQLNEVPLFYDYLNGFSDFLSAFQVNGDYSINFNYPGDYYYDSVNKIYISNPTRAQIVGYYFQSQFANQFSYTTQQVRIAYYYPVLKEALLDPETVIPGYSAGSTAKPFLSPAPAKTVINLSGTSLSVQDTYTYLVYSFQGINDPIASAVITNNIEVLDTYRVLHTFRYTLVNKYVCSYNQTNNTVSIQTPSLNTSLVNLLNAQYNGYLSQQLNKYNLSAAQYNALANTNANLLAIIQNMYDYLQIKFAQYFAVNYGTYSKVYYANQSNTIYARDGLDASGVSLVYNANVVSTPTDTNIMNNFRVNPQGLWPNMKNLPSVEGPPRNMGSYTGTYPTTSNFPYVLAASNIDLTRPFINSNGDIYTDSRREAGDILVDVEPGKYSIFQFRSKYRQTLQVETLPRQTNWRYPAWNKSHAVDYPLSNLFDASYCYVEPGQFGSAPISKVTPSNIDFDTVKGWANLSNTANNFGYTFDQSSALWSSPDTINITNSNGRYYRFQTPLPYLTGSTINNVFKYPLNLTFQVDGAAFPDYLYAFLYHDIAAFSADVGISTIRNESPLNYKQCINIPNGVSSVTYSFNTYANQQYYMILRPSTLTPASVNYKIVPWFTSTTFSTLSESTNFNPLADPQTMLSNIHVAKNADYDFLRLPIAPSTLWQENSDTLITNALLPPSIVPIGYDVSGVSNDLTDYVPFAPFSNYSTINPVANIRVDPVTNYVFQYNSPYNLEARTYFYPGTNNAIMTKDAANQYTPTTIEDRQYKILNYYDTNYIQDSYSVRNYGSNDISPYTPPYSIATTSNTALSGYTYSGANSNLQLGGGMCGFMFLPGEGNWAFDRITFKTNFTNPAASSNVNVHVLGIFITAEIYSKSTSFIQLSNALAICVYSGTQTYSTSNTLNLGFDAGLGSYYTYSNISTLVTRPLNTSVISGFTQNSKTLIGDPTSYYSIIAFQLPNYTLGALPTTTQLNTASLVTIQNVTGSPVAYPYACQAFVSSSFYDGSPSPSGKSLVLSTPPQPSSIYGPSITYDESVSQYEESIPYVNTNIHYIQSANIIADSNSFTPWSNIPLTPTFIHASVPNYMLMQDGNFTITTYSTISQIGSNTLPQRNFNLVGNLTTQLIYPDNEGTTLIGVSGNSSNYCFLGASNISPTMSQLRFKLYNPTTGVLTELPQNPIYTFSNSLLLQHFVFHDTHRWFLSAADIPLNKVVLQGDSVYSSNLTNTYISYTFTNTANSELQMPTQGAALYFAIYDTASTGFCNMTVFSFDSSSPGYIGTGSASDPTLGYNIALQNTGALPAYYKQISVSEKSGIEEVLLTNTDTKPFNFFTIYSYIPQVSLVNSNTNILISAQEFSGSNGLISPSRIIGGVGGSRWAMFTSAPYIMGNRNDAYDSPISLDIAWQIFFPTIKIQLRKLTNGSSPIVDLTNITYPEWPHTMMFSYSNFASLSNDIGLGSPLGKWGNENNSNFMTSDVKFNGYYFNSFLMNVPLFSNYNHTMYQDNEPNDYYIAIRGWLPTEKFQTMVRFYLPNRYDFGYLRFTDISNEIGLATNLSNMTNPPLFNPTYLQTLLAFNSNFVFSNKLFGSNSSTGYPGSNLSSIGFGDFLNQYVGYYSTFTANSLILTTIQSSVNASINNFISKDLQYILPPEALQRQRYTDALLFQIRWKSQLTPNYLTIEDEWGLGWNLGYPKQDTPFATIQTAPSFYKIQQDYIYLRLNPEFNINRMDSGGKESYKQTREPSGITNQYYCKLLLTSFGGNATTFIHNPITFQQPINCLRKLEFQWIDANGAVITNNDAEWHMTVNITEYIDVVPTPTKMIKILNNTLPLVPGSQGLPDSVFKGLSEPSQYQEPDATPPKQK